MISSVGVEMWRSLSSRYEMLVVLSFLSDMYNLVDVLCCPLRKSSGCLFILLVRACSGIREFGVGSFPALLFL